MKSLSKRLGLLPLSVNGQNQSKPWLGARIHRIITQDDFPPQELAVMRLTALGYSNKETADQLKLSTKTVECYRARLYKRLGIRDGIHLVHCAIKLGVIPCPVHGAHE